MPSPEPSRTEPASQAPPCPAIRVMMMPRDTNAQGTIFGGVILSYIDQAGAVAARKLAPHMYVTVAMDAVEFKQPVFVGDVLNFFGTVEHMGRTSVRIRIKVEAERWTDPRQIVPVTEAVVTYVAVDAERRKIAVTASPPAGS